MNKKVFISGFLLLLALAPFGVKNIVDKSIELNKTELDKVGVDLSIVNTQGYINTNRKFTLTISDEVKFKEFFKNLIVEEYPLYSASIDGIYKRDTKELDDFIKGIVFKGNIENSNINPFSNIKVYTYLDKLSDKIMNKIKNDNDSSQILLPLFNTEALAFNMEFDNNTKLKSLVLKDINEKFNMPNNPGKMNETIFQVLGYKVINNSTEKEIIADINLDKINFDIKSQRSSSNILLNNLKYNINYENQFINSGNMKIQNINISSGPKNSVSLGETDIYSKAFVTNGIYSSNFKIYANKFKLIGNNKNTSLDDLELEVHLNGVNYNKLENLLLAYNTFEIESYNAMHLPDYKKKLKMQEFINPLLKEASSILNDGLSLKVNSKVSGLTNNNLNLNDLAFVLDAKLNKNNLTAQTFNQFALLSLLDINAELKMLEEDYASLSKIFPSNFTNLASMYLTKEKGKVKFNLILQRGKIEVNGQAVN